MCNKTIFCYCDNIGRPKSCDTVIAMEIYCNVCELLSNPSWDKRNFKDNGRTVQ